MADGSKVREDLSPQSPAEQRAIHAINAQGKGAEFVHMSNEDARMLCYCVMAAREFDIEREDALALLMRVDLALLQGSLQLENFGMNEDEWSAFCEKYQFCSMYRDFAVPEAFGIRRDASRIIEVPGLRDEFIHVAVQRELDRETLHPIMKFQAKTTPTEIPLGRSSVDMFGGNPGEKAEAYIEKLKEQASLMFGTRGAMNVLDEC